MRTDWIKQRLGTLDDDALLDVAEAVTEQLAGKEEEKPKNGIVHLIDLDQEIEQVRAERGKFKGYHTGYTTLDDKMGGLEQGSVILIGGETSNGKSALATNIALNVSKTIGTLYISLEMTRKQILERLDHMTDGFKDDYDLMFQQEFDLSYKDLEPLFLEATEKGEVKVVVLDYLQYLGRGMDEREVAKMSKTIKKLALKYNIAFIVIVSLRKAEAGKNKRKWYEIETEDLMGTAAIGYDADTIVIASRKDQDNEFDADGIYVKVLKTRNTALDYNDRIIRLKWDRTRITEDWTIPVKSDIGFKEVETLPL